MILNAGPPVPGNSEVGIVLKEEYPIAGSIFLLISTAGINPVGTIVLVGLKVVVVGAVATKVLVVVVVVVG